MNKKEITAQMSKDAGITSPQADKAFRSLMEGIKNSLKKGERAAFSGFGSFEIKMGKKRKARNPTTGKLIAIPEKKRIKFKPGKILKNSL